MKTDPGLSASILRDFLGSGFQYVLNNHLIAVERHPSRKNVQEVLS